MASTSSSVSIRVAFEGCGHGCLNDIYASVEKAATLKGWDGVDLLIIGGDFQAVRNSYDMACMSVPQKYKELGDFHEYYSGKRKAPYLTIFIGGNHEAGNHLFELYYGGWVAPNIYYMGAANVIRCGPLRIAGMSGIWKSYDYRKPHFERLPYNRDDVQSIYHVRELDIRKLLQIRTQVDLGLSHDWPKQIEYSGDYDTLFRKKNGFRQDSEIGRLGNLAAKHVLDRLRPAYWFSAHLHVGFAACLEHGDYIIPKHPGAKREVPAQGNITQPPNTSNSFGFDGTLVSSLLNEDEQANHRTLSARTANEPVEGTGPAHTFYHEGGFSGPHHPQSAQLAQPATDSTTQCTMKDIDIQQSTPVQGDAGDTQSKLSAWNNFHTVAAKNEAIENSRYLAEQQQDLPEAQHHVTWKRVDIGEDGVGRKLAGIEKDVCAETMGNKKQKLQHDSNPVKNSDEIDLDLDSDPGEDVAPHVAPEIESQAMDQPSGATTILKTPIDGSIKPLEVETSTADVAEEIRNQLPTSFARPQPGTFPVNGPLPEAISNKTTRFLALDKCLPNREFLQLVEFNTISDLEGAQCERPYSLQYDREWLAITRVFANDLHLGDPTVKPPADKGDTVYSPQIVEEEKWIEEHVAQPGKMTIPENFVSTAPPYDPAVPIITEQMPPEYNNSQTAQFCELIGIENKFHLSNEEQEARMAAGPRPNEPRHNFSRHPRRDGGHGSGRGRGGGRGGSSRGGNRGRGRGRGRGYR
ncbi:lariat debranching enzyme, C-terminal domain-containing protein [Aspergillus coremiiformis]|uniref:Lariat debranching enzyme, C-terminal domain-containing protein n=1 Tax=Aspergillus coremiiformis TaxID=138285 RepID=A0A5N6ZJN9_9EURO|nr:lariat debranching enzyme, C-terminal domain-containing protein [Aspergillus coremiiformis]